LPRQPARGAEFLAQRVPRLCELGVRWEANLVHGGPAVADSFHRARGQARPAGYWGWRG